MIIDKSKNASNFASLKAAFGFNRRLREREYGPFFIERNGTNGDVGYPPGFELVSAESKLTTAYETVQKIESNFESIINGIDSQNESSVVYASIKSTIKLIVIEISEFKDKLSSKNVTESDVKDFAENIVQLTDTCLENLKKYEHNYLMQAGVRALADILQITRRSIPDSILVYNFSGCKTKIEEIRNKLVKQYIVPYYNTEVETAAQEAINNTTRTIMRP